jgi:hypothetical protein
MKMVKSALLVSAAGLVAASGAQAADLPVKAKPVEYVKICSLYGAGFYYIPGTDICMKIGGYVRFQEGFGETGSITFGPLATNNFNNRESTYQTNYRTRAISTFDTRQQTAYGTLRTYMIMGITSDSVSPSGPGTFGLYANRAFIQIAGFTFGLATSFFDFVSTAAVAYNAGALSTPDTGDTGQVVAAYTAQFGNGLSATISAEATRRRGIDYLGDDPVSGGAFAAIGADEGGINFAQDIVGNIRVDQAWGSAQVSAALHPANAAYYGAPFSDTNGFVDTNGHPGDEWGWAVSAGLRLNAPMIGPGDYFQGAFVYAEGATKYASNTPGTSLVAQGGTYAFMIANDGGFTGTNAAPGFFELTTAWSAMASFEHFWTPSLRTSLYGSYFNISRPDNLNDAMCANIKIYKGISSGNALSRADGCDLDSNYWVIGSRSQWNVTKDLYVGIDVSYMKLETAHVNTTDVASFSSQVGKQAGLYRIGDLDAWYATWRIHRDIVP